MRIPTILLALTCMLLVACGGSSVDNSTPDGAIKASVNAFAKNDVKAMVYNVVPADKLAEAKAEWDKKRAEGMNDQEKAQFNMALTMLTAEGAEDNIFAMIQPQLAEAQSQVQMGLGMISGMGAAALQSDEMSEADKKQMEATMTAIQTWVQGINLTDEAKVKQAIGIACSTVRNSGIKTADDIAALTFDGALEKAGSALGGLKQILALYDLNLDTIVGSIQAGTPTINGDTATVPMTVTLFGQTSTGPAELVKVNGKWYGKGVTE